MKKNVLIFLFFTIIADSLQARFEISSRFGIPGKDKLFLIAKGHMHTFKNFIACAWKKEGCTQDEKRKAQIAAGGLIAAVALVGTVFTYGIYSFFGEKTPERTVGRWVYTGPPDAQKQKAILKPVNNKFKELLMKEDITKEQVLYWLGTYSGFLNPRDMDWRLIVIDDAEESYPSFSATLTALKNKFEISNQEIANALEVSEKSFENYFKK